MSSIKIIFTSGPRKGNEFIVRQEVTLGRKQADLLLKDDKVSSRHARIYPTEKGFEIEDLNSSNGLKVNDVKVKQAVLKPGDVVKIGSSFFSIAEAQAPQGGAPRPEKGSWQETLDEALSLFEETQKDHPQSQVRGSLLFERPFTLEFMSGPQTGLKQIVALGPKEWGARAVQGVLLEPGAPPVAFRLIPEKSDDSQPGVVAQFEALHPHVHVNGEAHDTYFLKIDDRISIGHTVIVVRPLDSSDKNSSL